MQAFGPEIQGQFDRHFDLLEEPQRERELAALVDFEVRERERQRRLSLLPFDGEGHRAVRDRIAGRRLNERDEHAIAALLFFRPDPQFLNAKRPRAELPCDQTAVELEFLLLPRSFRLQLAHHALRIRLRLPVHALADLGDRGPVPQRRVLLFERPVALSELESLDHGSCAEVSGTRASELESGVAERERREHDERDAQAQPLLFGFFAQ